MATILITGLKSDDEAKAFINWYCNSGEQDIDYALDDERERGADIRENGITINLQKTYAKKGRHKQDENGNWIMDVSDGV
jgi:hypothetical protein